MRLLNLNIILIVILCIIKAFVPFNPEKNKEYKKAQDFVGMQNVKICVFYEQKINCLMFSPNKGKYNVFFDGKLYESLEHDFVLQLTIIKDSIEVRGVERVIGKYRNVEFIGIDSANSFKIKAVNPDKTIRIYDDNLSVKINAGNFKLINEVNLDNYVSSVVESETGVKANNEFYKVQSIICRTYALGHLRRHELEEFNLCDQVHCQVDHGSLKVTEQIRNATKYTSGLVMVDQNTEIALAAFHSNCGGNTVNSEDVWSLSRPYLRSICDSFCMKQNHSNWEKKIAKNDWKNYLSTKYKVNVSDSMIFKQVTNFNQYQRKSNLLNNPAVPLKTIRSDYNLKSTYFNIESDDEFVYLTGKGYGHGVGLCQEGAMQMAKKGYSYKYILEYYYKSIHLLNLNQISFFRE